MTTKFLTIKFAKFPFFIVMELPKKNSVFGQLSLQFAPPRPPPKRKFPYRGFWRGLWNRPRTLETAERRRKPGQGHFYCLRQTLVRTKPWFKRDLAFRAILVAIVSQNAFVLVFCGIAQWSRDILQMGWNKVENPFFPIPPQTNFWGGMGKGVFRLRNPLSQFWGLRSGAGRTDSTILVFLRGFSGPIPCDIAILSLRHPV